MSHTKATTQIFALVVLLNTLSGCVFQHDRGAARGVADRIHSQMIRRDFATIYNESHAGFKTIELSEFVTLMNDLHKKLGQVKNIKEVAYQIGVDSSVGRTHTLVFEIEGDSARAKETLVFVHADNTMKLWKMGIEPLR